MSPEIELKPLATTATQPTTMNEKADIPGIQQPSNLNPNKKESTTTITTTTHPLDNPQREATTSFLTSLKPFFTLPSPIGAPSRRLPALLMLATTALLFTLTDPILVPQAAAAAANSTSTTISTPSTRPNTHYNNKPWNTTHDTNIPRDTLPSSGPGPIPWDTPCTHPGEEGIWNCMATTWQRCAQGRWSVIMRSGDPGTVCIPGGITPEVKFVPAAAAAAAAAEGGAKRGDGESGEGGQGAEGGQEGGGGQEAKWSGGGGWGGPGGRYWSAGARGGGGDVNGSTILVVVGVALAVGVVGGLI